jgi:hypothetical protein
MQQLKEEAGDPQSFIGRELIYRDSIRTTVSGIIQPWTERTDLGFTDFISEPTIRVSRLKNEINLDEWNDIWSASQLFVKLAPETAEEQASAQLKAFGKRHFGPKAGTGDFVVERPDRFSVYCVLDFHHWNPDGGQTVELYAQQGFGLFDRSDHYAQHAER